MASPSSPALISSTSELLPGELPQGRTPPPGLPPSDASSSSSDSTTASSVSGDVVVEVEEMTSLKRHSSCDSFSVCSMKTVSLSSLLLPSPCFTVLLLLCPPLVGFLLFLFVQYFVPVLVDILMAM